MELHLISGLSDSRVAEAIGGSDIWLLERKCGQVDFMLWEDICLASREGDILTIHEEQSTSFARNIVHFATLRLKHSYVEEPKLGIE